jgi:hypothetical protein
MMDSRAEFERWMIGVYDTRLLRQGENYMGSSVQKLWEAWQASPEECKKKKEAIEKNKKKSQGEV